MICRNNCSYLAAPAWLIPKIHVLRNITEFGINGSTLNITNAAL